MPITRTLLFFLLALPATVAAQDVGPTPAPPSSRDAPPELVDPGPPVGGGASGETLGERLGQTQGIIRPPPGIDQGIIERPPSPQQFPTPVIPPAQVTPESQPR